MKDFDEWNSKKKMTERKKHPLFVHEREIWWCSLGLNIGSEQDGKNELFERPVLVLKRFSPYVVLIVPFTSKSKDSMYEYQFTKGNTTWVALLSQMRLLSTKRFSRKIRKINNGLFEKIKWHIVKTIF